MGNRCYACILLLLLSLTSHLLICHSTFSNNLKPYIVYIGSNMNGETSSLLSYQNMLQQVAESNSKPKSVLHHYKGSINGFVAKLTKEEAERMAGLDGVVSVFPDEMRPLLTTKSWDFIGFPLYVERKYFESDVIIGVIDSGIWPESYSFNDKGFSPPPSKWKGTCQGYNFSCNNKVIGARYYRSIYNELLNKEPGSPRDSTGHGTHVASIAAGNPVSHASMLGLGQGTLRGGAPSARIAVYKICWSTHGCESSLMIQAFNDAIADGVDILSVSIGGEKENLYSTFSDPLSIGAFHAMKNGVLTVFAAGNSGPHPVSLQNFAPWSIVVGAGTIDRKYITKFKLGDNKIYKGMSLNTFDLSGKMYPIIYGRDAPNKEGGFNEHKSRLCSSNSLDAKLVKGKIVFCEGSHGREEAFRVGAIGVLIQDETFIDTSFHFPLPGCYLQSKDITSIHKYIQSTRTPTATIFKTCEEEDTLAPVVASFSSRGPNIVTPDILKPDLVAPGVDIIASWSPVAPISDILIENKLFEFNIVSGTSMSCPHVSGAAGYIKAFQPTWSPAAIRSALMTTAKQMSPINNEDAEFAYGAGQIDPIKALNPGLIYDVHESDYIRFLCGQGYNRTILQKIAGDANISCSDTTYAARDLNYPSFALKAPHPKHHISASFKRTVTNVGLPMSTYRAIVTAPNGLHISVTPDVLSFSSLGENHTYVLTVDGVLKESIGSASLIWDDGRFQVRSPIVVYDERAEKNVTSPNFIVQVVLFFIDVILTTILINIIVKCR